MPAPAPLDTARRSGFTLLEVLIAIAVIVILGTVVGINLKDFIPESRQNAARMQLGEFKTALQIYVNDNGFPPTQRQGLEALVAKPAIPPIPQNYKPNGYLDSKSVPKDPWGRDYAYLCPGTDGEAYEVVCYGADGEEGGEGYDADLSTRR
ncbi:MAG: type II secretion system major pseudopilin GspG [Kiritimatiellia bacterium]|jgi:general secretion pathway protein G